MEDPTEDQNDRELKGTFVFELDHDNATLNPLRDINKAIETRQNRRTVTPVSGSFVYQLPLTALGLSICFVLTTVLGIFIAKGEGKVKTLCGESTHGGIIDSFISNRTILELEFLVINFAVGHFVVLRFRTKQGKPGIKRRFVALVLLMVGVLAIIELVSPNPEETHQPASMSSEMQRNGCKLYTRGYPESISKRLFLLMNITCPAIANSGAFHMLDPDLEGTGIGLEESIGALDGALLVLKAYFPSDFPVATVACQASFPKCEPVNCTARPRCNLLQPSRYYPQHNWYNLSYERRKELRDGDLKPARLEELLEAAPKFVADKKLAALHVAFMRNLLDETDVPFRTEWYSLGNSSTCIVERASGSCHYAFNSSDPLGNTKCSANLSQLSDWRAVRTVAFINAVVLMVCFFIFLAQGHKVVYYSVERTTSAALKVSVAQFTIFASVLFSSSLAIYGGTLLQGYNGTGLLFSYIYFAVSTGICYSSGFIIKPTRHMQYSSLWEQVEFLKPIMLRLRNHQYLQYCWTCFNPQNPQYVYRVLLFEAVEVGLQIGALLSPQSLNGDIVLTSVIVIFLNAFATAMILQFFRTSPNRVVMLITVEVICDAYFMLNGILRLQSNANLSFLEHLALIKPVATINLDLYDLYSVLQIDKYEVEGRTTRFSVMKARVRKCRLADIAARWDRILLVWLSPVLLLIFAVITALRYQAVVTKCTQKVGDIALCATEKYYFNVSGGILGTPLCNFEQVSSLQCDGSNVHYIPDNAGQYFPAVESIHLQNNPRLTHLPTTFTSGNLMALKIIDVSHTNVQNFPYGLATSRTLREIHVKSSPVSIRMSWHNHGIHSLSLPPAFIEAFQMTLKTLNLSSNNITEFPRQLCQFLALEKLDVSRNHLRSLQDNSST